MEHYQNVTKSDDGGSSSTSASYEEMPVFLSTEEAGTVDTGRNAAADCEGGGAACLASPRPQLQSLTPTNSKGAPQYATSITHPPALIVSNEMELSRRQAEEEQLQREGVLRKTSSDTGTGEFSNGTISQTSVEVLGQLTADESPSQLGVLGESPRRASTPEGIPGENTSCEFGGTLRRSHDRDSVSVSHDEKRRSARTSIEVKMTRPPEMPRSALRSTPNSRSPSPASDTSYRSCQLDTSSAVGGKKVCFMDC